MLTKKEDAELLRLARRANLMKATRREQSRYFELRRKGRHNAR